MSQVTVYTNNKKTLRKKFVAYMEKDEAIDYCTSMQEENDKCWYEWTASDILHKSGRA